MEKQNGLNHNVNILSAFTEVLHMALSHSNSDSFKAGGAPCPLSSPRAQQPHCRAVPASLAQGGTGHGKQQEVLPWPAWVCCPRHTACFQHPWPHTQACLTGQHSPRADGRPPSVFQTPGLFPAVKRSSLILFLSQEGWLGRVCFPQPHTAPSSTCWQCLGQCRARDGDSPGTQLEGARGGAAPRGGSASEPQHRP